eukprot:TRINITY_DN2562_c0_g1_i6.p1 TRINITY_DN2562_c0_g1~~TRINITY_DN2562_c0_g1_i6.p1  ORF type:complete len:549 (+),score=112.80 TRINITY_DN2562_c0_g1_i6:79-1725(+)
MHRTMLVTILGLMTGLVAPQEIQLLSSLSLMGMAQDMAREGEHIYLVRTDEEVVKIYDASEKTNPTEVGTPFSSSAKSIMTGSGKLYVAQEQQVTEYDITTQENPVLGNTFFFPSGCTREKTRSLAQSATHIFATCYDLSISSTRYMVVAKGTMVEVGMLVLPGPNNHLHILHHDGKLYSIVDLSTLTVIDVSDPTLPTVGFSFPSFNAGSFTQMRSVFSNGYIYAVTDSSIGNLIKFNAENGARETLTLPAPIRPADESRCVDIQIANSRLYLACEDQGIVVLQEPIPNTFTLVGQDTTSFITMIIVHNSYIFGSGDVNSGLNIYSIPEKLLSINKGLVELIGGTDPVIREVGVQTFVEEEITGQRWVGIPDWLHGSTVHMGGFGRAGMSLKLVCPVDQNSLPCTFYVALHNCLPCSSAVNGGLPNSFMNGGFEAGGCGPKYVPTFNGAPVDGNPQPAAIFKLEVEAGSSPVVIPVVRKLLHFAVFVHSTGQQCSLHEGAASCNSARRCRFVPEMGCVDDRLCMRNAGPQPGPPVTKCVCAEPLTFV